MELMKEKEIKKEENILFDTVRNTLLFAKNRMNMAEVCIKKTIGFSVHVRNGLVENIEFHSDGTLFITVYNKFSKGSVSSKDFSSNGIKAILDKAIDISKYVSSDFFSGLPEVQLLFHQKINLDLFHPHAFSVKQAVELALLSENSAFLNDKRIVNSEGSFFNSYINFTVFGNSLGMLEKYKSTQHSISTCVIAKDGKYMERDFDYSISRQFSDLGDVRNVGIKSAERAISRLGSKKIKTKTVPVIFSSEISSSFFSYLVAAISGNNVYQKSTFLINSLKTRIFPEWLSIKEDPHIKKGLGSKPFDDEGVSTYSKYIVKNGVLQTWLLNSYFGRKLSHVSTGNSGGIYNWIITNKNISFKQLLDDLKTGFLITELMGQGVDIVTGNYSRGAAGFWVENGIIKYPVNEITISGNLKDMWKNISSISNDRDTRHSIQCGSILLSNLQISGN